jgi:hypothetical protein
MLVKKFLMEPPGDRVVLLDSNEFFCRGKRSNARWNLFHARFTQSRRRAQRTFGEALPTPGQFGRAKGIILQENIENSLYNLETSYIEDSAYGQLIVI